MESFRLIALTLSGLADPTLAIAATRAGELGLLNLDYTTVDTAREVIARLLQYTKTTVGIRLDGHDRALVEALLPELDARVGVVVLAGQVDTDWIARIQADNRQAWVEITDVEQAIRAAEMGADAVIAKGQEAGGWIGEETAFILTQRVTQAVDLPVYVQGGIGSHTIAGAYIGGAAGVILDSQLALAHESRLPDEVKFVIAKMDGSETVQMGGCRFFGASTELVEVRNLPDPHENLHDHIAKNLSWKADSDAIWLLGQDAAFATQFADKKVSQIFKQLHANLNKSLQISSAANPLAEQSLLAQSHHTRYPIVQGPMTRVSDKADFALRVASGGGLPFLALALMREAEADALLRDTQAKLGDLSWGVGILGFVPQDLRREQLAVLRKYKPPFAIIAGGRPDQARQLEQDGIATYLHVPSPALLELFVEAGARRFIFEGRECGGHIGPRSSFVLWEQMISVLLSTLPTDATDCHVLFAGGIHDGLSSAMVAGMAAPLVERGVKVGVLLGTSYLFTQEAVETGAIVPNFQHEALQTAQTVTVESGAGHAIRCVQNPFTDEFEARKRQLLRDGLPKDVVRERLDALNIGRLRIASKGITRHPDYKKDPNAPKFVALDETEQHDQGMFMIGQLASLRDEVTTIAELHESVSAESTRILQEQSAVSSQPSAKSKPANVAIVGLECVVPGATNRREFWENILNNVYAIGEIPPERFDVDLYFDADRNAKDKIYSRWGGFLPEIPFDPLEFGMPPNSLKSIDPMQLLSLKVAKMALEDAGYAGKEVDHTNTSVILGASGGLGDLGGHYLLRSSLPLIFGEDSDSSSPFGAAEIISAAGDILPEWTEDSFAGILLNVAAGRIANRLDLGGFNYIVDAACGSSLTAVHLAVQELTTHSTDMVIVGGVDTVQAPFGYLCFSKTQALTASGVPRTFDANADGIAISEGVIMLVLKRLADAERDGDRIYAVIQGASGSSDGKALGMTAPRPEGQQLALQRTYQQAGIDPKTVALFEAHGTGTAVGDRTEATSLGDFLLSRGAQPNQHAVGSVKSLIGHTKAAAGVAGLAKITLALYHKVLPPTANVTQPNPKANFGTGPLYVNSETRPWISGKTHPRRAGVSAFGFGGTNFHAVAEAYEGDFLDSTSATADNWASELVLFSAETPQQLNQQLQKLTENAPLPPLRDLAVTFWGEFNREHPVRLAIVATDSADLLSKIAQFQKSDFFKKSDFSTPTGIYYSTIRAEGKIAFLFSGQGAQYPNMLRDLAIHFDEVRAAFDESDRVLHNEFDRPLSHFVFPPPAFDDVTCKLQNTKLTATNVAQPALGSADLGAYRLLTALGIQPDMAAGHSYGEYAALAAAGVFDAPTLARLSAARGNCIVAAAQDGLGTMAAVSADAHTVHNALNGSNKVWIANHNAPTQTIIAGSDHNIANAVTTLQAKGLRSRAINVAAAFHSPIIAPAQTTFATHLAQAEYGEPAFPVYSNTTAGVHSADAKILQATLSAHLTQPVRFVEEIEAMVADGARIFVECGPRNILTNLTSKILADRPHLAVAIDHPNQNGLTQLQKALAQLVVNGVPVNLDRLFAGRNVHKLENLRATKPALSRTAWLVSGGKARRQNEVVKVKQPINFQLKTEQLKIENRSTQQSAVSSQQYRRATASRTAVSGQSISNLHTERSRLVTSPISNPQSLSPMLQFQQMMGRFLDSQRRVMETYLSGKRSAVSNQRSAVSGQPSAVSDRKQAEYRIPNTEYRIPRTLLTPTPIPTPATELTPLSPRHAYIVTDDGKGIALAVVEQIRERGGQPVLVQYGDGYEQIAPNAFRVNVGKPEFAARLVADIRASVGLIGGIAHLWTLAGMTPLEQVSLAHWRAFVRGDTKALFLLLRECASDLHSAPNCFVLGATLNATHPAQAGVTGLLKSVALEWDNVRVQTVDLDESDPVPAQIRHILTELTARNPEPFVQYRNEQRYQLKIENWELKIENGLVISEDDVLLITGGARGITAQVALYLARKYRCRVALVGRSPLPAGEESAETRSITDPSALKRILINQLKTANGKVTPKMVDSGLKRLLKEREMRGNLAALRATGAEVAYFSTDVRDLSAMQTVVEQATTQLGAITGVIHGAGVIEDKLLVDKSAESFDRVFDTKADCAFILSKLIDPQPLKFMAFFSSVAGALGNRGQSDYAAGNDVMNKLAIYLDRKWDARIVSLCWGPWANEGMVSAELERQFAQRGISLITIEEGCQALDQELHFGKKGEAEVIYVKGDWNRNPLTVNRNPSTESDYGLRITDYPFLQNAQIQRTPNKITITRIFDITHDRYLDHHRLDGKPVLPAAVAAEWLCEVAQAGWPELAVTGLRDLRVLGGVVFEGDRPIELQASAERQTDNSIVATIRSAQRIHYRAVIEMGSTLRSAPAHNATLSLRPFPKSVAQAYDEWLFHGSIFQAIERVHGISEQGIVIDLAPSSPAQAFASNVNGNWLLNPVAVDCGLQAIILWARHYLSVTPIIMGIGGIQRFASSNSPVTCQVTIKLDRNSRQIVASLLLLDAEARKIAQIDDVLCPYSLRLNRLGD